MPAGIQVLLKYRCPSSLCASSLLDPCVLQFSKCTCALMPIFKSSSQNLFCMPSLLMAFFPSHYTLPDFLSQGLWIMLQIPVKWLRSTSQLPHSHCQMCTTISDCYLHKTLDAPLSCFDTLLRSPSTSWLPTTHILGCSLILPCYLRHHDSLAASLNLSLLCTAALWGPSWVLAGNWDIVPRVMYEAQLSGEPPQFSNLPL